MCGGGGGWEEKERRVLGIEMAFVCGHMHWLLPVPVQGSPTMYRYMPCCDKIRQYLWSSGYPIIAWAAGHACGFLLWDGVCVYITQRTSSSLLETEGLENVVKAFVFTEVRELHVDAGSQPRPEVGGTGEDVAEVFAPHEGLPFRLDGVFHLLETLAEPGEDGSHVPAFLHGDDTSMILLVYL